MNQNDMLDKSVGLLLVKLSFPAMAGMMVYSMFSLIDTFFVALLGSASLAALTICIPIQVLIVSVASATGVGITSLIARTLGSGNVRLADNIAWHGVLISLIYGGVFLLVGQVYTDSLLLMFGATPETFMLGKGYLNIILCGCVVTFVPMILCNIIQGEGNTFIPIMVSLVGMGLNVALDPVLIFGLGKIKAMGLNGAALATVCAQAIANLFVIGIILKRREFLTWQLKNFRPSLSVVYGIYKVGFPTMIMEMAGVLVMGVLNRILAGYSYTAIAALGIFLRVRSLVYMPIFGLTRGTMPIAAFAYGAGDLDRVKETIIKASALAFLYMTIAWVLIHQYTVWIASFFSSDPTLTVMAVTCLRLATLCLPLMGPLWIFFTVLQGLGKGFTVMWLSLFRQLGFFLPLLMILPGYYSLNGVWISFPLSEFLCVSTALFFLVELWQELQIRNKLAIIMLLQKGYALRRLLAWLKWQ